MFPMHLCEKLAEKSQITLNMIQPSRRNPNISEHAMMEGNFDSNKNKLNHQAPRSLSIKTPIEVSHGANMGYKAAT